MAVPAGHPDAVRELRPVPRARFLSAGERRQADIVAAGIFSKAPQAGIIEGICRVHAGEWGWAGHSAAAGGGRSATINGGGASGRFRTCNE